MGWIITAVILFLLAILPLGISVIFDEDGPLIRIIAGPVKLKVFPARKKDPDKPEKPRKEKKEKPKEEKKPAAKTGEKKKGGPISDFYPFVTLVLDFLTDFRHSLRVDILELKLVLGGGDPADLAINYGKTCTAVGNIWPWLETWFVIRKRKVEVECDFEASGTTVSARLDLTITLGRLLAMVVRYGYRGIKEFLHFRKKRNGGTTV